MNDLETAQLRGAVLRAWRTFAGRSLRQLATSLPISPAALSQLETGQRGTRAAANLPRVGEIAAKLALAPEHAAAMADMWTGAGTFALRSPAPMWRRNFQPPSRRCWAWLRVPSDCVRLQASGWWGEPLQGHVDLERPVGGLFVQFPTSVPNPALEIHFADPGGWADFGWGVVPDAVAASLGAVVLQASEHLFEVAGTDPPLGLGEVKHYLPILSRLRETAARIGVGWRLVRPNIGQLRTDKAPHALDATILSGSTRLIVDTLDADGERVDRLVADHRTLRDLREARGMSRDSVVDAVNAMDPYQSISIATLRALEDGERTPAVTGVSARLDMIYEMDGALGVSRSFDSTSPAGRISFPDYWIGPVWLQVTAPVPAAIGVVELAWGDWRRRQTVQAGSVATTRKSVRGGPPLEYSLPPGWAICGGLGQVPTALDINHGWYPKSLTAGVRILRDNIGAVRRHLEAEPKSDPAAPQAPPDHDADAHDQLFAFDMRMNDAATRRFDDS